MKYFNCSQNVPVLKGRRRSEATKWWRVWEFGITLPHRLWSFYTLRELKVSDLYIILMNCWNIAYPKINRKKTFTKYASSTSGR